MRHRLRGKQLGRNSAHRKALRRNMAASLFEHGAIRTTAVKAKELRSFVEQLITTARKGTLHARRRVISLMGDRDIVDAEGELQDKTIVQKLFDEIAPRYEDRPGGYTRIIRLSDRRIGDGGEQVLLQLVEEAPAGGSESASRSSRRRRRATKRQQAVEDAQGKAEGPAEEDAEAGPPQDEAGDESGETVDEESAGEDESTPDAEDSTPNEGDEKKE